MTKPVAVATYANPNAFRLGRPVEGEPVEFPIVVGTGVTESCGSDAYPYEVIEIRTANKIIIRSMNVENGPGGQPYSGMENWIITSNPEGRIETLRKGKDGRWKASCGTRYYPGHASRYRDPHF